jgi:Abnormal spindle-like microcephaly-assoc'd, ASPM-SPD-2-Hydin/Protein of unknown function (DUF1573)
MFGMTRCGVRIRRFLPCALAVWALSATNTGGQTLSSSRKLTSKPDVLWFGMVEVGQTRTLSTTLTNTTSASITISRISKSTSQIWPTGVTLPFTIGAGKSRVLKIDFKPAAAGQMNGTITLYTKTFSETIYLHGTGVRGWLKANPMSLSFGTVPVGSSKAASITLTNTMRVAVGISRVSAFGTGFSSSGLTTPLFLRAGESYTFRVVFTPKSSSAVNGHLSVLSYAPNPTLTIPVAGNGTSGARIDLGPTSMNFGGVIVGAMESLTASLSATGGPVTITGATSNSTEFGLSGLKFPFTIPAGHRVSFSIVFAPRMSGTAHGKISFNSNAADSPVVEALTGSGITASHHSVSLSWKRSPSAVAHYNVYRSGISGGPYTKIASVPGTSYRDTSVQAGGSYYYVTTAVSSNGKESSRSNQVHALIP